MLKETGLGPPVAGLTRRVGISDVTLLPDGTGR
jgi:hypothetical protein